MWYLNIRALNHNRPAQITIDQRVDDAVAINDPRSLAWGGNDARELAEALVRHLPATTLRELARILAERFGMR